MVMSGDIQGSRDVGGLGTPDIEGVETRDAAQCPIMPQVAPRERMTRQPQGQRG